MKTFKIGEDKLGDLIDKATKKQSDAIKEIVNTGYLSLIFKYFKLTLGNKYIILCQNPETTITVGHDAITNTNETLTKTQINLLYSLSQSRGLSKEEIINKIWGYEYDSLRHDSIIYSNIARLKKSLKDKGQWIYSDENKYYLDSKVEVIHQFKNKDVEQKNKYTVATDSYVKDLNYRQIQLLNETTMKIFSASDYSRKWNVTRMTANRDLKDLHIKGLLTKYGRGRSTRYCK